MSFPQIVPTVDSKEICTMSITTIVHTKLSRMCMDPHKQTLLRLSYIYHCYFNFLIRRSWHNRYCCNVFSNWKQQIAFCILQIQQNRPSSLKRLDWLANEWLAFCWSFTDVPYFDTSVISASCECCSTRTKAHGMDHCHAVIGTVLDWSETRWRWP